MVKMFGILIAVILIGIVLVAFLFGSAYCLVVGAKRHTNQEADDQAQMEWLKNLKVTRVNTRVMSNLQFIANNPTGLSPVGC